MGPDLVFGLNVLGYALYPPLLVKASFTQGPMSLAAPHRSHQAAVPKCVETDYGGSMPVSLRVHRIGDRHITLSAIRCCDLVPLLTVLPLYVVINSEWCAIRVSPQSVVHVRSSAKVHTLAVCIADPGDDRGPN